MSQPFPVGQFRFLEEQEIENFDVKSIPGDAKTGYILKCDLLYPESLHQLHNDYPMAPEHLTVDRGMLSQYALGMIDKNWKFTPKTRSKFTGQNQVRLPLQKSTILSPLRPHPLKSSSNNCV